MTDLWLTDYYNRVQGDYQTAFTRRDNVTNWAYTLLAAILAIYFGFFSNALPIESTWRLYFISGVLVIMVRFLFQSMIAYGFILRYRFLKTEIEKHWMKNLPDIDTIKKYINLYDHGRIMPPTGRNRFWNGQVRSGFIITLIIPLILLVNEFNMIVKPMPNIYYLIIISLIVYVILEVINIITYDQIKKS